MIRRGGCVTHKSLKSLLLLIDFVFRGKPSLITVICMDPHLPNKLIVTKYCFLIHRDDTSFVFFLSLFFVTYQYYFFMKINLFFCIFCEFLGSMFRNVPDFIDGRPSGSILTSYHQDWCQEIKLFFVGNIFSSFHVLPRNLPVKGLNEEIHL